MTTQPRRDPTTLAALTADPANRRTHDARNLDAITASLKDVGAARSIVIDEDDVILAGNGVTQAAQTAGLTKLRVIVTRACRALEIEPQYVQVAIDRWEAFTGQRAQKVGEAVRTSVTPASVTHGRQKKTAAPRAAAAPKAPPPQPAPARRGREQARPRG